MPRLPVDGKKVIEHRITLGGKERELLADLATSYRIDAISGNDSVVEVLGDGTKVIAALGTLGALLELLGITDVFDFDDDMKATIMPIKDKVEDKIKEKATDPGFIADVLKYTTPFGVPFVVGEQAADFVRDRI
jgi:hypothetical protein